MNNYNSSRLAQDARKSSIGLIGRVAPAALEAPIAAAHCDSDLQNLSLSDLRAVKRQQLDAFWNAPQTAHDWHVLAAIHGAWESLGVVG